LLRSALGSLEDGAVDPPLLAYAFLAKLAAMAGLHPTLRVCVDCGSEVRVAFSYARGGAVCAACVDRADPKTSDDLLNAWSLLLDREWDELRGYELPAVTHRDLGALMLSFVQWHTESRFRAFALLPAAIRNFDVEIPEPPPVPAEPAP
jgi:recombinational DNA repair protein (RecF pathway)